MEERLQQVEDRIPQFSFQLSLEAGVFLLQQGYLPTQRLDEFSLSL